MSWIGSETGRQPSREPSGELAGRGHATEGVAQAWALARLADALLPGDDLFPQASAVGAHGVMASRLREQVGAEAPDRIAAAFLERGGLADAVHAAAMLEADEPAMFDAARVALTYAYYEAPAVIEAVRALGYDYNDAPQPDGYAMRPFDPERDAPSAPHGRCVATHEVRRVDLSGLAFLRGTAK